MANDGVDAVRGADDGPRPTGGRARWYPVAVAVYGLVSIVLVALVPVFQKTRYIPFTGLIVLAVIGLTVWRNQRPERPVSDARITAWVAVWFALYLLVVWVIGPDMAGQSVPLWAALGVVTALPPFIEAGLWLKRSNA